MRKKGESNRKKKKKKPASSISRLRTYLGMTRQDFADLVGINIFTVSKWEWNRQEPSPHSWKRIQDAFIDRAMRRLGVDRKEASKFVHSRLYPAK